MLVFEDDYIIIVPTYYKTDEHKHAMLHVIISSDPISVIHDEICYEGTIVFINQDISHSIDLKTTNSLVLLIDPSTQLSNSICEKYLKSNNIFAMDNPIQPFLFNRENEELKRMTKNILKELGIHTAMDDIKDDRINDVLNGIKNKELLYKTVPEIASIVSLSPSRLSHLFKQETGMRLKNYLLMYKLRYVYKMVSEGKNLTQAAMEMSFSDSSHLAAMAKKTTGLSISTFFKKK